MFYDLGNNVVLMHYPQPSRHMPQGMHKGNSHQPLRRTIPPLLSRSCRHYARQPPQMQDTNIVLMQYVLSTRWDTAELFSQTGYQWAFWQKATEKRICSRANLPARRKVQAQVRCCCLPSHFHLPAWKKTSWGHNCAGALCHFLKLH